MSITTNDAVMTIKGRDELSAVLNKVGSQLQRLEQQAGSAGAGFLKFSGAVAVGNVAASAFISTVGKISGALTSGVSASTSFGASMSNIKSVLPTADAAQFGEQIADLALQLGKDLPLSASDAGAGLEALAKKGISASDILGGAGKSVALLASVTGEDLASGAEVAAAAINTFGLSGEQVTGVTNLMAGAVLKGGTTVSQFGQGLQQAGTTVATFGGTIEDVTLALGVMAKAGVQGSDAGTSLKTMYQNLIPTTKAAITAQRELGLITADGSSAFIDATGKAKSYEEISRTLGEATKDLSAAQRAQAFETIFGTDAVRAASIAAAFGTGKFGDFAAAVRSVDADEVAHKRLDNLAGDMKNLEGSVETLQIGIGQKLEPAFRGMAQAANTGVGAMIDAVKGLDFSGIVDPIKAAFDEAGAFIKDGGSITGAVEILIQRLGAFASSMFGSGFTLISTFAQGMVSGISAIFQAVSAVAEAIASFLVGQSPPPEGPLSNIDQDGKNLVETYAEGMGQASLGAIEGVAAQVQATLTNFEGLEAIGEDVAGQIRLISDAMEEVSRSSEDLKFQVEDIKQGYEDQLEPLKDQLDAIDDVNDSLSKQLDITDQIRSLDLKAAEALAKGDPARRAEIAGRQEANKFAQEALQLRIRELELSNKPGKDGKPGSNDAAIKAAKAQLLKFDQQELGLKKELAGLVDRSALAEIAKQKTALDLAGDARDIQEQKAKLERELQKIPIEQQIKDINKEQTATLKPLEEQQRLLDRQEAALRRQQTNWQNLEKDIKRAIEAAKPEKGAGGAGGGAGGVKLPAGGAGGAKLPNLGETLSKSVEGAKAQAMLAGEKLATNVADGMRAWFAANGARIIGGALGALFGGVAFGPLGALIGAGLGAAIGQGIQKAVPDIGERATALVTAVQTAIAGGLPGIQALLGEWGAAFVGWIAPQIPGLLAQLGTLAAAIFTWSVQQEVAIAAQLQVWGAEFIAWVAPQIPPLLVELGALATQLISWVGEQLPGIAAQLLTWGTEFVNWVGPQIPLLLAELGKLAGQLWAWFSENAPLLTQQLVKWGVILIGAGGAGVAAGSGWLADAAIKIIPELVKFLGAVTGWIVGTAVPELAKFALKMGGAIISGIVDGVGTLATALGNAIAAQLRQIKIDVGPFHLSAAGFTIDQPRVSLPEIGARAAGGPTIPDGLTLVGENGPELLGPTKGFVLDATQSAAAISGGGAQGSRKGGGGGGKGGDPLAGLVAAWSAAFEQMQGVYDAFWDNYFKVEPAMEQAALALWASFSTLFASTWQGIYTAMDLATATFWETWSKAEPEREAGVLEAWTAFTTQMSDAWTAAFTTMTTGSFSADLLAAIADIQKAWDDLGSALGQTNIGQIMEQSFSGIASAIQPALQAIRDVQTAVENLYQYLSSHTFTIKVQSPNIPSFSNLQGFASGGTMRGLGVVGENGPELIAPSRAYIMNHRDSLAAMSGSGGGSRGPTIVNHYHLYRVEGSLIAEKELNARIAKANDQNARSGRQAVRA